MRIFNYITRIACAVTGGLLVLSLAGVAQAQDQNELASNPGYINMNEVEGWFNARPKIEVNLQGTLLELIAGSAGDSESDFSSLVSQLKAIQVRGYPMNGASLDEIKQRLTEFSDRLEQDGWERVVYIRDEQEMVNIYVRPNGDSISGLTVLATNPEDDESIFINIVGSISPDQIGKIGRGLNIEQLEDVPTEKNKGN